MCVLEQMHILWRKSLNENGCSFDILDKKEFAQEEEEGGGGEETALRKLPNKTFVALSCT